MTWQFWTWLMVIGIGVLIQPELAQAAPLFQAEPVESCAKGIQLFDEGKNTEALPLLESGFTNRKKAIFAQPENMGRCALALGLLHHKIGDHSRALDPLTVALELFHFLDNRELESQILTYIGLSHHGQGRYMEALEVYLQAWNILNQAGDQAGKGAILNQMGMMYQAQGRLGVALVFYQDALDIIDEVGDLPRTLNNIGEVYRLQGHLEKALDFFQQALELIRQEGDRTEEAQTISHVARVYEQQGRYREALDSYQQALKILREVGAHAKESKIRGDIGSLYQKQGRYAEALHTFQQALGIARQVGARLDEGRILNHIGQVYNNQGHYIEALKTFEQALGIARQVGARLDEGRILNHIGQVYNNQGRYIEALNTFEQALSIARQVGARAEEGIILSRLGETYRNQGAFEKALEFFDEALSIQREMGTRVEEGRTLSHIGIILQVQARYAAALDNFQQAQVIAQEAGARAEEGVILKHIGQVYGDQGHFDQALDTQEQALAIVREVGVRAEEAAILKHIGEVYSKQGRFDQALDTQEQALTIVREIGNWVDESYILSSMGLVYQQQGSTEQALAFYEQALDLLESRRVMTGNQAGPTSFILQETDLCTRMVKLYHQQSKKADAFFTSERCRARFFLDSLSSHTQNNLNYISRLIEQEQEFYDQRVTTQELLVRRNSALDLPDPTSEADLEKQLAELEEIHGNTLSAIEAQNKQLTDISIQKESILTFFEVQERLDDQITLLSYWVLGNEGTLVFVISHDQFYVIELPEVTPHTLNTAMTSLNLSITNDEPYPKPLRDLHTWLVAPVAEYLNTPLVGIIPHQMLHQIPFAALTDGERYFIYDYAVFTLPSASTLPFLQANRKTDMNTVLALGNGTRKEEVKNIANLYDTQALTDRNATESEVWSQAGEANILHLAAPTSYDQSNPLFSAVYLTRDDEHDGRLEVHEIYGLDLRTSTNLVVLSGLPTQLGTLSARDELLGLNGAFLSAGAPCVMANLWNEDDQASLLLMEGFYRSLRDGDDEARALREAQIELQEEYAHPSYWAGFVLIGLPENNGEELVPAEVLLPTLPSPPPSPLSLLIGLGGGLLVLLISGFAMLARSSGLPPILLLRQKSALIAVGLQYRSYHQRWKSEMPLEKLVVLLMPASECLTVKELEQKLSEWRVPIELEQIQTALDTAVRDGLFLRQKRVDIVLAEPRLARVFTSS